MNLREVSQNEARGKLLEMSVPVPDLRIQSNVSVIGIQDICN